MNIPVTAVPLDANGKPPYEIGLAAAVPRPIAAVQSGLGYDRTRAGATPPDFTAAKFALSMASVPVVAIGGDAYGSSRTLHCAVLQTLRTETPLLQQHVVC